jgi:signal transduction histidine kinase
MLESRAARGLVNRNVLFTTVAVAIAFALVLMPAPRRDDRELVIAGLLAVALLGLALCWRIFPRVTQLGVPLGYLVVTAVLRDAAGGSISGFGGLFLLPVLWLAISAGRREMVLGLVAMGFAQVIPLLLIGGADYPASAWRSTVVQSSVAAIAGFTIQKLVAEARLRADESLLQNERLRGLDRMKDEFVALVSHELRTPLTSIIGYLEMISEDDAEQLSETHERYLGAVQRNVDRLNALVNDLLFLARVDSGQLSLQLAEVDYARLLVEAAEVARPAAEAKEIALTVESDELPPGVADGGRLAQIVDNLVSNAIKFTPENGQVTVRASADGASVAVEVSDTGMGIAPDELPYLFTRFFRASAAVSNGIPGTGLGLAISQAIAEAHGGTIDVTSELGEGTTFRLRVPLSQPAARATARVDAVQ